MKRIVDGVTYNTATATKIAASEWDETDRSGTEGESVLYQTRGGAFFLHVRESVHYKDRFEEWAQRDKHEVAPITREKAQAWIMEGEVELFADVFGEPPEAAEEQAPEATVYVRLPASLKERIEAIARDENLSLNSWAIRCLETCAAKSTPPRSAKRSGTPWAA